MGKIRRYTGRICLYLIVFAIAVLLAGIGLKANGIAPFGPHSILRLDMNEQYTSYFSFLKRNFGNWQQFLYSSNMTLGGNTFGLTAYYLLSPFNLIIFLFSNAQLPIALALIAVLKNGAAALSMLVLVRYFTKRYQLKVTWPLQAVLAVSWGLSGWMLHFSMDLMWQDPVILLPLIVLGVEHYIEHTKWAFYSISLGLALILNYYIGYMIALFLVHYFILRMIVEWRIHGWHFKKIALKLTYFGAISLVTVGLAWVIIWPTLRTLQGVKGTEAYKFSFANVWNAYRLPTNFFNLTYTPYSWQSPVPVVYTGVLVMTLLIAFFCANRLPAIIRVATGAMVGMLILESYFQGTNTAWHGFSNPIGMNQRWSFVFSLVFILMALFALGLMQLTVTGARRVFLVTTIITIMVAFRQLKIYGSNHLLGLNQFTRTTFTYNVVLVALVAIALVSYFGWPRWRRLSGVIIAVLGLADLGVAAVWSYGHQPPYFSMPTYSREVSGTNAAVSWIKQHDHSSFYRMELNYQRSRNDAMEFGYDGLTHYSSSQPLVINKMMQEFGYGHGSPWTSYNGGSTRAVDTLFGVKYIIDGPSGMTNQGSRLVTQGLKKLKTIDGYTIYENPLALKIGVVAPTNRTTAHTALAYHSMANSANVNHVYQDLSGVPGIYMYRGGVKETKRDLKTKTVTFTIPGDGPKRPLYLQLKSDALYPMVAESMKDIDIFMDGQKIAVDGTENETGIIPLGAWPVSKTLHMTLKVTTRNSSAMETKKSKISHLPKYFVTVGYEENFQTALANIAAQPVDLKRLSTLHWVGTATATKPDQSLVLTLPQDDGWEIRVDGKRVKQHQYLELMKINLKTKGKHRVELRYGFPQLRQGLTVSLLSLIGLLGLLIIQAFTIWGWRIRNRRLERIAKANAPLFDPHYFDYR